MSVRQFLQYVRIAGSIQIWRGATHAPVQTSILVQTVQWKVGTMLLDKGYKASLSEFVI